MSKLLTKHIYGDIIKIEDYFRSLKKPYKVQSTNYSTVIQNDNEKYIISPSYIGFGFMNLLSKLKKEINIVIKENEIEDKKVRWFNYNQDYFNDSDGSMITLEVDISKAYLYSAYYQKFISKEYFEHLLRLKKSTRIKLLGSLASKKRIFYYNELGIKINEEIKKNDDYIKIWNNICFGVDSYMNELTLINGYNKFIFYWFDNLFMNISQSEFNPIHTNYILKYSTNMLNYKWDYINLLNINIENRNFNFRRIY